MIDRDILLFLTGGVVGAASAMLALLTTYWLEGMRLHRQWRREDLLRLREKQAELNNILSKLNQQPQEPEDPDDA
jgi:hypothetical protein